ncbi:MAG: polyphosphate kinase 1 [Myxococcales bacterium]|nr:polyphosphate kinase 1 [Myxococcales bacterium]
MATRNRPTPTTDPDLEVTGNVVKLPSPRSAGRGPTRAKPRATPTPVLDAAHPSLLLNRELAQLDFNFRVLAQAEDTRVPLLERLRYLTICSTNLDEFFEIRVAGLKEQIAANVKDTSPDGLTPQEMLDRVGGRAHALVERQYQVLNDDLLPALEAEGIRLLKRGEWSDAQEEWISEYFETMVHPVLTPIGLDPAHPFPRILNKALTFIVTVDGPDAFQRDSGIAVLQVPRSLPRLIVLPRDPTTARHDFVLLSSVIHACIGEIFPGMRVTGCFQFRVTRDSDLWVDEEETLDLLTALKGELPNRKFGEAVRLEVVDNCKASVLKLVMQRFGLTRADLYRVNGPVNVHRLEAVYDLVDRPDLKFPIFTPGLPFEASRSSDMFALLRRGDILLHHPFQSFSPVVELLNQAATDKDVLAIKMTLYRTGPDSPLVEALITAARAGKEVTAVVELRARFDEERNIDLATRLQQAGATVAYGIVGYKTHAKMLLIVRREANGLRRYVHLGTGNYHVRTTRQYTDFSLLTVQKRLGEDVHKVFMQLTGPGKVRTLRKLLQAPFTLHERLIQLIGEEAAQARAGEPARIVAKMNSLAEPRLIAALYEASRAGVQIELIVRGVCCLRPGLPGISENIHVRSVIGRFLEHCRIFYFRAGGTDLVYCSSADWMARNFFRRVEIAFPMESTPLRHRVVNEAMTLYLADEVESWHLHEDGTWTRVKAVIGPSTVSAQVALMARLGAS